MGSRELFVRGVKLYSTAQNPGHYQDAARYFQTLVTRGIAHEDLYYNLGCAYYQAGQMGLAVYNFERALLLHPGHANARYNLRLARKVITSRLTDSVVHFGDNPLWVKMATWLNVNTQKIIFLVLWVLFFAALIGVRFLLPGLRRIALITATVLLGLGAGTFGLLVTGRAVVDSAYRYGIVLPDELHVKVAPEKASNDAFVLHAGLRVRLGSADRTCVKISLPNGMEGWVEKRSIGRL